MVTPSEQMRAFHATPQLVSLKPTINALSEQIGAEILGVDLKTITPKQHAEVRAALLKHHLLIIRNQTLESEHIKKFAEMFGELEQHVFLQADGTPLSPVHTISNLDADGKPSANPYINSNYCWHSDKAYLTRPSWITMLYAVQIPPAGGDTQFANMAKAYEALPEETKRKIQHLRIVNSFEYMLETTGTYRLSEESAKTVPPVEHPIVRVHPDTGEKSLFVTMYTKNIVGMPEKESRALLDELLNFATQPQFVFTVQWRTHDVVFWDNRNLVHRAVANYDMNTHQRLLKRVVVRGTPAH